jgi:hypothetical protein
MSKATYAIAATAAGLLMGAGAPADRIRIPDDCAVVRVSEDGRETRNMAKTSGDKASARSASSSSSSSSSSVSTSSSSRSSGNGTARATASTTDANGRTITTTHDEHGCTVTIDER